MPFLNEIDENSTIYQYFEGLVEFLDNDRDDNDDPEDENNFFYDEEK